jgi:hypothetical protein
MNLSQALMFFIDRHLEGVPEDHRSQRFNRNPASTEGARNENTEVTNQSAT